MNTTTTKTGNPADRENKAAQPAAKEHERREALDQAREIMDSVDVPDGTFADYVRQFG